MTWADWQRAELHSLRSMLRTHYAELRSARAVWVKIGVPPSDPLRGELERTMRAVAETGRVVGRMLRHLDDAQRPDPLPRWIGKGFNVKLRPSLRSVGPTPDRP